MAQSTQIYRRSFGASVGAGLKSLVGNGDRRYYILVHKVTTSYHKAGESQQIILDEIELGRDPKCQVRFDETFSTVSRRHAAIVRDGDNWKLIQLSKTNSTYLNGHRIESEWYLQNGDEIQLSTNGPKLGFIVPEGKSGTVGSIGLTNRLNLFGQQVLKPYKKALWACAAALAIVIVGGATALSVTHGKLKSEQAYREMAEEKWAAQQAEMEKSMAELAEKNSDVSKKLENSMSELSKLKNDIAEGVIPTVNSTADNKAIDAILPYVYYIHATGIELYLQDGSHKYAECGKDVPGWSGTGFLLSDGRFVTARHVIENWSYWLQGNKADEFMQTLNAVANNGGRVIAHFICASSSGDYFECTSSQFSMDRSQDEFGQTENGYTLSLATDISADYAYINTGKSGGLNYDRRKSTSLDRGVRLVVLGFPFGLGAKSVNDIDPVYGNAIVATQGLEDGVILTTDTNYESGNSGGPALFADDSGKLTVVGIVSASAGRNIGFIVPINSL